MLNPNPYESCERNLFVFRANTCQQETVMFLAARDLSLTEELALLGPQVMLPLLLKSDRCEPVGWPLARPHVQNGHFPPGKATAINSHPARMLTSCCSVWLWEDCWATPSPEWFEFKIHREKTPRAEELDSCSASLESKSNTLRILLLRAANSLDV